jgi:hypothetical protein
MERKSRDGLQMDGPKVAARILARATHHVMCRNRGSEAHLCGVKRWGKKHAVYLSCPSAAMWSNPFQCITLSMLIIPPLLLSTYFLANFPSPPESLPVHPSLSSLPPTCNSWNIYPEDLYQGGKYITFPHGTVRANVWWGMSDNDALRCSDAILVVRSQGGEKGEHSIGFFFCECLGSHRSSSFMDFRYRPSFSRTSCLH